MGKNQVDTKEVTIREVNAKSILRKHKKVESWFLTRYGMNLYRGCAHNCVYCDGRSEKYMVDGEFGWEITVKTNAIDLLRRELDPHKRRTPLKPGFIGLGGGVGDSYQPIERKYKLSRRALQLIYDFGFPVHILTKSTLVERDVDLIKKIHKKKRAIVSFSFSSTNDNISRIFEPGVPSPTERLETIKSLKKEGIFCGMFLMPVIPFVTDKNNIMNETIKNARDAGVDFVVFGGMTLKEGRQKDYFYKTLEKYYPDLIADYHHIYKKDPFGSAIDAYNESIHKTFNIITNKYHLPKRIPPKIYSDMLDENDKVVVILEQIDYLLKIQGKKSPYGFAGYSISKIQKPLSTMKDKLRLIKGIGPTTEKIILEILNNGTSSYYEKLLNG